MCDVMHTPTGASPSIAQSLLHFPPHPADDSAVKAAEMLAFRPCEEAPSITSLPTSSNSSSSSGSSSSENSIDMISSGEDWDVIAASPRGVNSPPPSGDEASLLESARTEPFLSSSGQALDSLQTTSINHLCAVMHSFFEDEDDNERLAGDVDMQPLAKRRKRPRISDFPRILKSDVRRHLATMFGNVMNSADMQTISSFLRQFCVSSCRSVDYSCCPSLPRRVLIRKVEGVDAILDRLYADLLAIPDFSIRITESVTQHGVDQPGSKVIMKMHVKGTKISQPQCAFLNVSDQSVIRIPSHAYDVLLASGKIRHDSSFPPVPAVTAPFAIDVDGTLAFLLDNNHRIYRMEYAGNIRLPLLFID